MTYITNRLAGEVSSTGDLIPSSNVVSLGTPTHVWGNLYVSSDSIFLSNPDPSVPPTAIGISAGNLLLISRGGLAVQDNTGQFDTFQVDPTGQVTMRSNVALDPHNPALRIIGSQSGISNEPTQLGTTMIHITGTDGNPSVVLDDAYGTDTYTGFIGRRANGTAAVPTQLLAGDLMVRFGANAWGLGSPSGFANFSTARIEMYATENQTNTTRGSNVQIVTTANGTAAPVVVATFNNAGISLISNVLVGTDLTVTGNSIAYGHSTTYGNVVSYGNLVSYGVSTTLGGLLTNGNTQVYGDSRFYGNLAVQKGVTFSDGSIQTVAGVAAVTAGTGIQITSGPNNSFGINNTGVTSVTGTAKQITATAVGGAVTLSLPQNLDTAATVQFGNLTVHNITITGNTTSSSVTTLNVSNKVIYAGNGATTTSLIDGGGFVLGNSQVAVSMLYSSSPPGWNFNQDIYIAGNAYVSGSLQSRTGTIVSNLAIGRQPAITFVNANLQVTGNGAGTVQVTNQNLNGGSGSSTDFVATADTGSDTANYIDLGINSSNYSQAGYGSQYPLDGYLYTSDSNLVISTQAVGKRITFTTDGVDASNVAGYIAGRRWVLGAFGTDDGVTKLQVAGGASFTSNVTVNNIIVTGTIFSNYSTSTLTTGYQPNITTVGTLTGLSVANNAGFGGNLSVASTLFAQNSQTNSKASSQTLQVASTATVNQLYSNVSINPGTIQGFGAALVSSLTANTTIQSGGSAVFNGITSNTGTQTNTLNVTGAAQVNSMTANLLTTTNTFNVVGQSITNSLINNVNMTTATLNVTRAAVANGINSNTNVVGVNLQSTGQTTVASLVSNANVYGATVQSGGVAQVNSLVSNNNVFGATLNTSGLAQTGGVYSNGSIQATTFVSAATLNGNTSVTAPTVNASTTLLGQAVFSNTSITAATVMTAQGIVSNSGIAGQTLNLSGALQAGSIASNSSILSAGTATVNALVSNGAISGTTINGTAATVTSLQSSGAATVASLVSNANTTTATLNSTGAAEVNSLISNTTIQGIGTATVNTLVSNVYGYFGQNVTINSTNTSTSTASGALVVTGGIGAGGNIYSAGSMYDQNGNVRSIPINNQAASYILTARDNGNVVSITTGGVTVPASVFAAPYGQAVTIWNNSASNQTITQGSGATMHLSGTASTGNRTLAQYGLATVMCMAANVFVVSGVGIS